MTIRRKRRTGRSGEVSWDDLTRAQRNAFGYFNLRRDWSVFSSREEAEHQYWRHRSLIAEDFKRYPCKRPACWREFEYPKLLEQGVDVEAGEHLSREERRYLAVLRREEIQGAANRISRSAEQSMTRLKRRWLEILHEELREFDDEWGFSEAEKDRVRGGHPPHDIIEKAGIPLPWSPAAEGWEGVW